MYASVHVNAYYVDITYDCMYARVRIVIIITLVMASGFSGGGRSVFVCCVRNGSDSDSGGG